MILGVIACVVAALSLGLALWNYTALLERPKNAEMGPLLSKYAEELSKDSARKIREIETEWDNMYDKFAKLAGRLDRRRAIESPPPAIEQSAPVELTRSEILRRFKRK